MNRTSCPRCGNQEEQTVGQQFCSKCGHKTEENNQSSEQQSTTNIHINHTNTAQPSEKQTNPVLTKKIYIASFIIVLAFLIGLLASNIVNHSEEEMVIVHAKSNVAQTFIANLYVGVTELDLEFSNIDAVLVNKESKQEPGTYEVTGEVVYDETTYTFTGSFLVFDGNVFPNSSITLEE